MPEEISVEYLIDRINKSEIDIFIIETARRKYAVDCEFVHFLIPMGILIVG